MLRNIKILSFGPRDTCRRHLVPGQVPRFVHPGEGGHAHLRRRRADAHRHLRLAQEQRALQRLPHPAARHPGRPGLCRRRQHQHLRLVLALGHTPDRPAARSGLCRPLQGDRQLQLLPRPHRRGGGERDQRHQHREARTVHGRVYAVRALCYTELLKTFCKAYEPDTAQSELGVVLRTKYLRPRRHAAHRSTTRTSSYSTTWPRPRNASTRRTTPTATST